MKTTTVIILFLGVVLAERITAQTNRLSFTEKDFATNSTSGFVSHSKTIGAYRILYPKLTNLSDARLVVAVGEKHPELFQSDTVLSNEFTFCVVNFPKLISKPVASAPITNIVTLDGKVYSNVELKKVDPDGLVISCGGASFSICKVYFENLSDDLRERFHYNPEAASQFRSQQIQGMANLRAELTINDHIAALADNRRADEGLRQRQIEESQRLNKQIALAKEKAAEAQQKAADAAMIEAMKPPPQINIQQNNFRY